MSFSLNYSKCEIIVGLFLLNLFGYGKVKMLGGFITKKNPQNSACKCNHSFLMVLSMVVEIILEIIFLCWKLQVYNSKFPYLLRNGYLVHVYISFENLNVDIYVGLIVSIARFLYNYIHFIQVVITIKETVIKVVNNACL